MLSPDGDIRVIALVSGRFIVSVGSEGISEADFDKLVKGFSFGALSTVLQRPLASLPTPFPRKVVNEVNQTEDFRPTQVLRTKDRLRGEEEFQARIKEADMIQPDRP